jgi:hypothetical protein
LEVSITTIDIQNLSAQYLIPNVDFAIVQILLFLPSAKSSWQFAVLSWQLKKAAKTANRQMQTKKGGLAQLARAFAWHARGHRFDSDILHNLSAKSAKFSIKFADFLFSHTISHTVFIYIGFIVLIQNLAIFYLEFYFGRKFKDIFRVKLCLKTYTMQGATKLR